MDKPHFCKPHLFSKIAGGSSNFPCDDTFHGSRAFSEVETQAMADFFDIIADRSVFFLSVHAYSQFILLPYGFSNARYPDYEEYVSNNYTNYVICVLTSVCLSNC